MNKNVTQRKRFSAPTTRPTAISGRHAANPPSSLRLQSSCRRARVRSLPSPSRWSRHRLQPFAVVVSSPSAVRGGRVIAFVFLSICTGETWGFNASTNLLCCAVLKKQRCRSLISEIDVVLSFVLVFFFLIFTVFERRGLINQIGALRFIKPSTNVGYLAIYQQHSEWIKWLRLRFLFVESNTHWLFILTVYFRWKGKGKRKTFNHNIQASKMFTARSRASIINQQGVLDTNRQRIWTQVLMIILFSWFLL